ncbi:MAG TPA: thioredoxin family protein [Egibacteraceae bacterium]|jgi:thiol-disulfide isomerase/thioredoxin|nr:thioredoxin family protein [Egibacteraceae bacterium]
MSEWLVLATVVAATGAFALWWRAHDGKVRAVDDRFTGEELAAIGAPPERRLLVAFTAPSCAPCTMARRVLEEVAGDRDDVAVRAADVGDHLDLARAHGVLRTPTTFALEVDGTVLGRVAGVPTAADVHALLDAGAVPDSSRAA